MERGRFCSIDTPVFVVQSIYIIHIALCCIAK